MSPYWRLVVALVITATLVWVWILSGGDWPLAMAVLITAGGFAVGQEINARD